MLRTHAAADTPVKPFRIWLHVGDRDNYSESDGMHVFARYAGHCDRSVKQQTLPQALAWLWKDYRPAANNSR